MAKRRTRRRKREGSIGWLLVLAVSAYLWWQEAFFAFGMFLYLALVIWAAFFKRTVCDVQTKNSPDGCGNEAYGRLRACYRREHKRAKNDALWAMCALTNPARRWRILWARSGSAYGTKSPAQEESRPRVAHPAYDAVMLIATVAGSAGTIAALVVQLT